MSALNSQIKRLCKKEGKKVQVSRGNMKEILSIIAKEMAADIVKQSGLMAHLYAGNPYPGHQYRLVRALRSSINREIARLRRGFEK